MLCLVGMKSGGGRWWRDFRMEIQKLWCLVEVIFGWKGKQEGLKSTWDSYFFNLFKIEEKSGEKTLLKVKLRKLLNYPYVLIKILKDNKNFGQNSNCTDDSFSFLPFSLAIPNNGR